MLVALLWGVALTAVAVDERGADAGPERTRDREWLLFIAEEQLANRQKFADFTCEFDLANGLAASKQEAISLGPTRNRATAKGRWTVSGERHCYEIAGDPDVVKRIRLDLRNKRRNDTKDTMGSDRAEMFTFPFPTFNILKTDSHLVNYVPLMESATVRNDSTTGTVGFTPFNMIGQLGHEESMSAGNLIRRFIHGDTLSCITRDETGSDGSKVTVVDFFHASGTLHSSHHLDPARGFLPIELHMFTGEDKPREAVSVYVVDIRACTGERWFPMRTIAIFPDKGAGTRVTELKVTQLECDKRARDGELSLLLPAGTSVHDGANPYSGFGLNEALVVTPLNVVNLYESTQERIKTSAQRYAAAVAVSKTSVPLAHRVWRSVLLGLLLGAVVLGGCKVITVCWKRL